MFCGLCTFSQCYTTLEPKAIAEDFVVEEWSSIGMAFLRILLVVGVDLSSLEVSNLDSSNILFH